MKKTILLSASWCGPCQFLKKRLAEQNFQVDIMDIDSAEGSDMVLKYKIRSVPTLLELSDENLGPEGQENCYAFVGPDDILAQLEKTKKNV